MKALFLTTCAACLFLTAGCSQKPTPIPPVLTEPLFCDLVGEDDTFRWTQEEWEWRTENAPWNVRREMAINAHHEAECVDAG